MPGSDHGPVLQILTVLGEQQGQVIYVMKKEKIIPKWTGAMETSLLPSSFYFYFFYFTLPPSQAHYVHQQAQQHVLQSCYLSLEVFPICRVCYEGQVSWKER